MYGGFTGTVVGGRNPLNMYGGFTGTVVGGRNPRRNPLVHISIIFGRDYRQF
jgi:hypothetical protein